MTTTQRTTKNIALACCAALVAASASAQSFFDDPDPGVGERGTFAYWNFNSGNTGTSGDEWPGPIIANFAGNGPAQINMSGWLGDTAAFAGSTINALGGDPSGGSLSLQRGPDGNGTFVQFEFSMTNLEDLSITFATRGTATGFDSSIWSYSTDGLTFTVLPGAPNTATRETSFALAPEVNFGSFLDNASTVFVRYTLDGATSDAGNNRLDNLRLDATVVPEPRGLLALGALGLLGWNFLRKRAAKA
jgi:hypothetical protein